jgi:hypothetical protein
VDTSVYEKAVALRVRDADVHARLTDVLRAILGACEGIASHPGRARCESGLRPRR